LGAVVALGQPKSKQDASHRFFFALHHGEGWFESILKIVISIF